MKMNKSKQLEISKELVSTSMENISNKIRSTLITYVNNWNQLCLGLVISYLGIDSLDTKEALKRIDSRQVETIIHSAKLFNKSCDMTTRFVELLLSYANVSLEEDYKNIKENLQHLDKKSAEELLHTFRKETPVLQKELNACLFCFDDLQNINNRAIQIMLKYSDQQILAKALKGSSTEVQDKIFRNMSKRTSSMLKEDLEYMGPITFAETEEAKSQILQTLLKLEKERKLKINSLNTSDLIK